VFDIYFRVFASSREIFSSSNRSPASPHGVYTVTVLLISICSGVAAAGYRDGMTALRGGDYANALTVLRPLAEEGDARAQNALAYMYQRGLGVPKDPRLEQHWRRRAIAGLVGERKTDQPVQRRSAARTPPGRVAGTGSGFLVDRRGSVVTNHHVVKGCSALRIQSGKDVSMARIIRAEPASDLALLRLDNPFDRNPAVFRAQMSPSLGEPVLIAGYPLQGLLSPEVHVASGIVSALAGPNGNRRLLQISAPVQPGSSGGPVLDAGGRVIGVVSGTLRPKDGNPASAPWTQGVSFAVRPEHLIELLTAAGIHYRTGGVEILATQALAAAAQRYTLLIECFK